MILSFPSFPRLCVCFLARPCLDCDWKTTVRHALTLPVSEFQMGDPFRDGTVIDTEQLR